MNNWQQVPSVGTSAGPSACILNGTTFLAWRGAPGSAPNTLWWTKTTSATPDANGNYSWAAEQQLPATVGSSDGPAIAGFNGKVYMAWVGEGSDPGLYFSELDIANNTWTPQVKLQGGSSNAPALVGTAQALYMVWKGEADTNIWFSKTTDGKTWTPQATISNYMSSSTPALAANKNEVYMVWKGAADTDLWWSKTGDGKTWTSQQQITSGSSTGPALAFDNNGTLWMAWKAVNYGGIWYACLTDENNNHWSPQVNRYQVSTSDRLSLVTNAEVNGGVMMFWKGNTNDYSAYSGPLLLAVPPVMVYNIPQTNMGQGSASSCNFNGQLILNENGTWSFGGTYNCENSWPEPSQSWAIAIIVKDGNGCYHTFSTNGQTSNQQKWNLSGINICIEQNWGAIASVNYCKWNANNSCTIGNLVGDVFTDLWSIIGVVISDAETVVNAVAGFVSKNNAAISEVASAVETGLELIIPLVA